jgi:hypothetical protein
VGAYTLRHLDIDPEYKALFIELMYIIEKYVLNTNSL